MEQTVRVSAPIRHFLALYSFNSYWTKPAVGTDPKTIPPRTNFLLWQEEDGICGVALPFADETAWAVIEGGDGGFTVRLSGDLAGDLSGETDGKNAADYCVIEKGNDPYALIDRAFRSLRAKSSLFRLRSEKADPNFIPYLTWCTWDAFHGDLSEEKITEGLRTFREAGIPLRSMLIDDGVWDTAPDGGLSDIAVNREKFPRGLGPLVKEVKETYGIETMGLWHCLVGYWQGISPDGKLAKRYHTVKNRGYLQPWEDEPKLYDIHLVETGEIGHFYEEFHRYIADAGFDFVKIDGQGRVEPGFDGKMPLSAAMCAYQRAMHATARKYFGGNVINCMGTSNLVSSFMDDTNCQRNSDDYIPHDLWRQQNHVYVNAMNALWNSGYAYADWDMFQSHSVGAKLHAVSRAISGGPVFVSDKPGQQDFTLIRSLITDDGRALRCEEPARPTRDCLFCDCTTERKLLKLTNRNGCIGLIALFNCCFEAGKNGEKITERFSPKENPVCADAAQEYLLYSPLDGQRRLTRSYEEIAVSLTGDDCALFAVIPLVHGTAPLGLSGKLNGTAAIRAFGWVPTGNEGGYFYAMCLFGGKYVFYSAEAPVYLTVNGKKAAYRYDETKKTIELDVSYSGAFRAEIGYR